MFNRQFMSYILGAVLSKIAWIMLIPLASAVLTDGNGIAEFSISMLLTHLVAFFLTRKKPVDMRLRVKDMLLLTTLIWVVSCAFSSLPFILLEHFSFTDAYFEAVSGLTTTGSSVLVDIEHASPSLLMWRSTLQWIGALGFIVVAVAIFPFLNVGGMKLFRTESSDKSDKILPQAKDIAKSIIKFYLILTALCCVAYMWSEMNFFDAINHAFATVSTGGFSTRAGSMNEFNEVTQWICLIFMLLGSLPFLLLIQAIHRRSFLSPFRDQQFRGFILYVLLTGAFIAFWLHQKGVFDWSDSIRLAYFNLINLTSTSGFSLGDFDTWTPATTFLFALAFMIGGCSGSTSGGIKMFRFQILFQVLKNQILKVMHPNSVAAIHYNRNIVSSESIFGVIGFMLSYFIIMIILAVLMAMLGMSDLSALSAAMSAIGNIGPGLGTEVGPSGTFAYIPEPAKWLMVFGMLLGRLEIMTILILLFPSFWRK